MKQRSIISVLLLSLVTLGVYALLWLNETRDEMVALGAKIPRTMWLYLPTVIFLLSVIVYFLTQLSAIFVLGGSHTTGAIFKGFNIFVVVVMWLSLLSIIVVSMWWMYYYCQAMAIITGGRAQFGATYCLWILSWFFSLPMLWPGLIQSFFNDTGSRVSPPDIDRANKGLQSPTS